MIPIAVVNKMDEATARYCVGQINQKAQEIGALLIALRDTCGWEALGYASWTAFLESDELTYSRNRCLEFIRAFPVTISVREELHIQLKTEHALTLETFPEALRLPIAKMVHDRYGDKVTAPRIEAMGNVLKEAYNTGGHVTLPTGEQSALEAAYIAQRKEDELTRHTIKSIEATVSRRYVQDDGIYLVLRLSTDFPVKLGQTVKVKAA